jgi:RNA polymerase sigma-70 factor, ECF subfamily
MCGSTWHKVQRVEDLNRLALDAAAGQQVAWARLVRATYLDVWRLCAHLVDRQSADDLTQETFLRAVRKLRRFRGDGPVRAWLFTIARRVCAAEIGGRTRRRDSALDFGLAETVPHALRTHDHAPAVELNLLLAGLSPERREAFVLTQVIGCSYDEAAAICDCPVGTIRSRVARARDDLVQAVQADAPTRKRQRRSFG